MEIVTDIHKVTPMDGYRLRIDLANENTAVVCMEDIVRTVRFGILTKDGNWNKARHTLGGNIVWYDPEPPRDTHAVGYYDPLSVLKYANSSLSDMAYMMAVSSSGEHMKAVIVRVAALPRRVLRIEFDNGSTADISMRILLATARFAALRDDKVWKSVKTDGVHIRWEGSRAAMTVAEAMDTLIACDKLQWLFPHMPSAKGKGEDIFESVRPLKNHRLSIKMTTGSKIHFSFAKWLRSARYEWLRDPEVFASVRGDGCYLVFDADGEEKKIHITTLIDMILYDKLDNYSNKPFKSVKPHTPDFLMDVEMSTGSKVMFRGLDAIWNEYFGVLCDPAVFLSARTNGSHILFRVNGETTLKMSATEFMEFACWKME